VTFLFQALLSCVLTAMLIVWSRHAAIRIGLVDHPGGRKRHGDVVPLTGGLAITVGFFSALAISFPALGDYTVLFVATAVLAAIGLLDDLGEVSPRSKLGVQVLAAVLMTSWGNHFLIDLGDLFGRGPLYLENWGIPLTIFATVAVINGINMLDGMDGLAGGLAAIMLGYFALFSFWLMEINALKVPNVTSNAQWCVVEFLNKHRDQFAAQFVDFAKGKYCPMFSSAMACGDIAKYEACTGLLSSVGKADLCGANAASIGKEIAKKIDAYFTAQKSQFACQTVLPDGATPVSTKPVQYVCARPTQQHYCKQKYHELWTGKAEVLSCAKQLSTAYVLQMTLVDKEVAALKAKYVAVGIDKIDPLMVHVGTPQIFAALKQEHDKSGGKLGTGSVAFELSVVTPQTIDGVLQPAIVGDLKGVAPLSQPVASGALAGRTALVKPGDPDPAFKPSLEAAAGGLSAGAAAAQGTASSQQQKVLSGPAPTGPGVGRSVEPAAAAAQASPTLTNPQDAYKGERGLPKEEPGRTSSPPPGVQSPPTTAAGSTALPTARTQLPAVQTPPPQARLPSMQAPATANTVSTPPPTRSQLPAVRAPSPQSQLPAGQPAAPGAGRTAAPGAAPNWSALGAAPGSSPPMTAARVGAPSMTANSTAPASDAIARELAAAGCSAGPGGSRFACATRAGFDRCEALQRERRVEQCALSERR